MARSQWFVILLVVGLAAAGLPEPGWTDVYRMSPVRGLAPVISFAQ